VLPYLSLQTQKGRNFLKNTVLGIDMESVFPLEDDTISNGQNKVIRRMVNNDFALAVES